MRSEQEAWDRRHMARAIELAWYGQGYVEPNPLVGCVIARQDSVLAEGWHARFGGPHAEAAALQAAAGQDLTGATLYVTLEPCCHTGKTPPCTEAILRTPIRRVVAAWADPFPLVAGRGMAQLQAAGVEVVLGLRGDEALRQNAPYWMRLRHGRPWVIAKWAMSLDGRLATSHRDSQWISSAASRQIVHALRGRVDAILVGSGTALQDDPLLTARPAGPRLATRVILDRRLRLPLDSQLVRTAAEVPVLVVTASSANPERQAALRQAGCELLTCRSDSSSSVWHDLLSHLAGRGVSNLLVEGGSQVFGSLRDAQRIDELHVFVAPILLGGKDAVPVAAGQGSPQVAKAPKLRHSQIQFLDPDLYLQGVLRDVSEEG